MREYEFTVNLPAHGPCHCIVVYSSIFPGDDPSEFRDSWIPRKPYLEGLTLKTLAAVGSQRPLAPERHEVHAVLEYAENLILAGEKL